MNWADRKLELDRQIHVDKVDAEKEDRRLRKIDVEQRNKTLRDMMMMMMMMMIMMMMMMMIMMMMQEMCERGNSSST